MANRKRSTKKSATKSVETLTHTNAKRTNIPTAEHQSVMKDEDKTPIRLAYERRNRDLDPQLVWRGKDEQDWSDLVVQAPPLYIQEKVHPKVLIDDLIRQSTHHKSLATGHQFDLFGDFNGMPEGVDKTDFYKHPANWTNRMILGDSLQVMASLAEREGLRGKVQCIYIDPPYGIKFNSNFQWSTTSRDVKDGNKAHISREPEQVKAFRDTWRDGIHSYLTYLRDRLTVARDLLADSGSIFVQIGDENVHRVRAMMDEVFGDENCVSVITLKKTAGQDERLLNNVADYIVWFAKTKASMKFREALTVRSETFQDLGQYSRIQMSDGARRTANREDFGVRGELQTQGRPFRLVIATSSGHGGNTPFPVTFSGRTYLPTANRHWSTHSEGFERLIAADRIAVSGATLAYVRFFDDFVAQTINNIWTDVGTTTGKRYVVETGPAVIQRCVLMTTDPGDLVLDATCGSGTTAYVAEQWGRRWITIDTSRVALALARARIMGARYPYYLLADSKPGQEKEGEATGKAPRTTPTHGDIRQGFVYERVPHITLKSIANNAEIDVIWEKYQQELEPLRKQTNEALATNWEEWEIPRDLPRINTNRHESKSGKSNEEDALAIRVDSCPFVVDLHKQWWDLRIARQREIDASIAQKADFEYLYDKPYTDNACVRVSGPFTVESLSPHRVLTVDADDELVDGWKVSEEQDRYDAGVGRDFAAIILENLRMAGVQQAHKEDRIAFTSVTGWPGDYIAAEGRFEGSGEWLVASGEGAGAGKGKKRSTKQQSQATGQLRAGILIGPEYGTVSRPDLVAAAREAGDAGFDVLIACAFNYDAHSAEFEKLGKIPVLKARMNPDLHMAGELKNTGAGNLFVVFGEPDVEVVSGEWLVASTGRMVAHYESCKELSGLGSLEEINGLGGSDLPRLKQLSARGKVRADQPDAPGSGVGPLEHRGGRGAEGDGGNPAVSERGARRAGGSGDATGPGGPAGLATGTGTSDPARTSGTNQPYAGWAQALAAIETLKPSDFPLSLTTHHFAQITIKGVDVFHPQTGEIVSGGPDQIACWFIDTDYNEESFFVRHAYFLGANDPYQSLKRTLKAEIDQEAWESLHSDTSRPFDKPETGRIAVKVINHLGDEVMKVFTV